jgi:hypothetical protein
MLEKVSTARLDKRRIKQEGARLFGAILALALESVPAVEIIAFARRSPEK